MRPALFSTLLYRGFMRQRSRRLPRIHAHMAFGELVFYTSVPSREITTGQEESNVSIDVLVALLCLEFRDPAFFVRASFVFACPMTQLRAS
jgi:hypothetical protein